ncbi:hypothetical protein [Allonocardiopsis opalescens]|uniref:HEAT repeat protein n=1 Tax=Allonocardiopsis opalescens TaxID=1144618 RepID=A0A2T0QBY5_9ACTN|nr:hypothetical protein [Allonocardiopsis opalescens]PRY01422.1 hypothetical protein CLV72_1014 [Allonocardiopsis opalescens]
MEPPEDLDRDRPRRVYQPLDWSPDPAEVDAALDRGAPGAGVAVIALALHHPDPHKVLPRVARALAAADPNLRRQGVVALAHTARLHRTADRRCLDLLRAHPRGNEADDDLWTYVPRHRLPAWLWRHHIAAAVRGRLGWTA